MVLSKTTMLNPMKSAVIRKKKGSKMVCQSGDSLVPAMNIMVPREDWCMVGSKTPRAISRKMTIAVKQDLQDLKSLSINDYYFSFGPGLRFSIPQFPLRLMLANTFKSVNGKPVWGNGKGADWRFVLSFNIPNL